MCSFSYACDDAVHETPKQRKSAGDDDRKNAIKGRALPGGISNHTNDAAMEPSKNQLCDMHRSRRRLRILATALLTVSLVGVALLMVYLTYRPVMPQASVSHAAVYQLESAGSASNSSAVASEAAPPPYMLAASVQFTLVLHNPSDRVAVLYDGLVAYVTYRGELVAPPVELPAVVQERGADVALSLLFGGRGAAPVEVSEATVRALEGDCAARRVQLQLVVLGQVRYRSGVFRTGWRDLIVRCYGTTGLGMDAVAGGAGGSPLLEYPQCFVDA